MVLTSAPIHDDDIVPRNDLGVSDLSAQVCRAHHEETDQKRQRERRHSKPARHETATANVREATERKNSENADRNAGRLCGGLMLRDHRLRDARTVFNDPVSVFAAEIDRPGHQCGKNKERRACDLEFGDAAR